jgi:hypothetical protein
MSKGVFLLEVDAWTGTAVERFRLATKSFSSSPADTPANTFYDGRIVDVGSLQQSLAQDGGVFTKATVSATAADLANTDGVLDRWLGYGFDGRRYTLVWLTGAAQNLVSRGIVQGFESSDASKIFRLKMRDRLAELNKPLLTRRYLGTTTTAGPTAEGSPDMKGTIVPTYFGAPAVMSGQVGTYLSSSVPGLLVNEFNLLYQFCGNAVSAIVVYDGGVPLTSMGDYGDLSSLIGATLVAGQYATCLALGIARLGGHPIKVVSADVTEGATSSLRSAARVAQRMLALMTGIPSADIDTSTFDALHAFNPAEVGIYINDERTALDALSGVLKSPGAAILPNDVGMFQAVWIDDPALGTSVKTYTLRDCLNTGASFQLFQGPTSEGDGVPAYSVALTWGKVWRPMTVGDLAGDPSIPTDLVGGAARRDFLSLASHPSQVEDTAVKTAHLFASQLTGDTLFVNKADADAEALRRLNLNKVRRDRIGWPVPLDDAAGIQIGNVVTIDIPRFGYDGGRKMRVTGRAPDFTRRIMLLSLWG